MRVLDFHAHKLRVRVSLVDVTNLQEPPWESVSMPHHTIDDSESLLLTEEVQDTTSTQCLLNGY